MPVTTPLSVASYDEIVWPDGLIARHASGGARRGSHRARTRPPIGRRAPSELPCQIHDAELWFAPAPADLELAKALCRECPVRATCLVGAVDRREAAGVWGGEIFEDGRIVAYKRPPGRPRKTRRPDLDNWS
jgi:WhiB family transcriptional regulator, redox-sensing transcriptional regulator